MKFAFYLLAILLATLPARAQKNPLAGTFLTGADVSSLTLNENRGVKYSDAQGEADLLTIAKRNGWKIIRLRLWVAPKNTPESRVANLENVTKLGRRIKAAGLQFMLDIHYSDTWADPGQQRKPQAWDALPFLELVETVRDYTAETIAHLRENQALPDMVQIGNETKNGLLYGSGLNDSGPQLGGGFWEKTPGGRERAVQLLHAGLQGAHIGAGEAKIPLTILHLPDGQDSDFVRYYCTELEKSAASQNIELNFDIIGLSYYPAKPWDKKAGYPAWEMPKLQASMNTIAETLHKPVMVVETEWPYRGEPEATGTPQFSFTPQGQADFYRALIAAVKAVPNGLGIGVVAWDQDMLKWGSVFNENGRALPGARALGNMKD